MTQLHDTLIDFVKVLRTADIQVSPAETLDALANSGPRTISFWPLGS